MAALAPLGPGKRVFGHFLQRPSRIKRSQAMFIKSRLERIEPLSEGRGSCTRSEAQVHMMKSSWNLITTCKYTRRRPRYSVPDRMERSPCHKHVLLNPMNAPDIKKVLCNYDICLITLPSTFFREGCTDQMRPRHIENVRICNSPITLIFLTFVLRVIE